MKYFGEGLSEKHKELNRIIRKPNYVEEAKALFLDIHAGLHLSEVSGTGHNEVDALLEDLALEEFAIMPTAKDETIAWALWHIARIEDLTMNMLVARRAQIFDVKWGEKLRVSITDTGNALTDDEIMKLSHSIDAVELLRYRNEVGRRTREIVGGDYGYSDFIKNVDTIVMGKKTYRQIVTELSPDEWVYSGMKTYVATHHPQEDMDEIVFTAEPVTELVKRLKKEPGKDIWICGGADVANQLMEADEIDEYHLTIMPVILGSGIRLFAEKNREISLRLLKSSSENGVLDCVYGNAI